MLFIKKFINPNQTLAFFAIFVHHLAEENLPFDWDTESITLCVTQRRTLQKRNLTDLKCLKFVPA